MDIARLKKKANAALAVLRINGTLDFTPSEVKDLIDEVIRTPPPRPTTAEESKRAQRDRFLDSEERLFWDKAFLIAIEKQRIESPEAAVAYADRALEIRRGRWPR